MKWVSAWMGVLLAFGCGGGDLTPAERGRRVYVANCTACHHPDPTLDGTIGPAVAGSSLALIEARVLRAEYPPGYSPKRDTTQMIPLPFLEKGIEALSAYLGELGELRSPDR